MSADVASKLLLIFKHTIYCVTTYLSLYCATNLFLYIFLFIYLFLFIVPFIHPLIYLSVAITTATTTTTTTIYYAPLSCRFTLVSMPHFGNNFGIPTLSWKTQETPTLPTAASRHVSNLGLEVDHAFYLKKKAASYSNAAQANMELATQTAAVQADHILFEALQQAPMGSAQQGQMPAIPLATPLNPDDVLYNESINAITQSVTTMLKSFPAVFSFSC